MSRTLLILVKKCIYTSIRSGDLSENDSAELPTCSVFDPEPERAAGVLQHGR